MDKQSINIIVVYKNLNGQNIFTINYDDEFDSLFIYVLVKKLELKNTLVIIEKIDKPIVNNKGQLELLIHDISENRMHYHINSTDTMDIITELDGDSYY